MEVNGRPMETNLANVLTLSRIAAIPVVCLPLSLGSVAGAWVALGAYVFACVTDYLDGYVARARRQQSSFGQMLDPIADKLLVATVLLVLVGIDRLRGLHMVPAAVILCREILVSGLREYLAQVRVGVPVTRLAKWKTTVQMVAIGFLIVGDMALPWGALDLGLVGLAGLWAAALLTLVTGYDYLRAGLHHMAGPERHRANAPGAIDGGEPVRRGP